MLTEAETRARNIQRSRAAARRLAGSGWSPKAQSPQDWIEPPDVTIEIARRWPYVVYILRAYDRSVLYVGQTNGIYERLGAHLKDADKSQVCGVDLYGCHSRGEALALESRMIEFFDPPCNKRAGNRRKDAT